MTTAEQIVQELARINVPRMAGLIEGDVATPDALDLSKTLRRLVLAARDAETPRERPASQADSDDYAGVVQLAVVITHDGRIVTSRRSAAPEHALAPMLGALRHEVNKLGRDLASEAGMGREDFEALVKTMAEEAAEADFRRRALNLPTPA